MNAPPRRAVEPPGFNHGDIPIPAACLIRGLLFSGGVNPVDYATGEVPESYPDQVRQVFDNIETILAEAGGTLDDVAKLDVATDPRQRDAINTAWVRRFPDPASRPARKLTAREFAGPMQVQCEFIAVLDAGVSRKSRGRDT